MGQSEPATTIAAQNDYVRFWYDLCSLLGIILIPLPAGSAVFAHVGPRAKRPQATVRARIALETRAEKLPAMRKILWVEQ